MSFSIPDSNTKPRTSTSTRAKTKDKLKRLDCEVPEVVKKHIQLQCLERGITLKKAIIDGLKKNKLISDEMYRLAK